MSISVTVSGEDSTSVVLSSVLTESVSISEDSSVDVVASNGNSVTITVSSGDSISITGNYSNFVTGQVVRPLEIADFLTENQINTKITTATGDYNTLAANTFYLKSNPSGYITGVDLSALEAATGNLDTRVSSNSSDISSVSGLIALNDGDIFELQTATGLLVQKSETGNFVTNSETGSFYAASNPNGFITGVDLSSYVTKTEAFIEDFDNYFNELTYTDGVVTKIETYDSPAKTTKKFTKTLSYTSGALTQISTLTEATSASITKTLTYNTSNVLVSITKN